MNARFFRKFAILASMALLAQAGVTATAAQPQHVPARASRAGLSKHLPADFAGSLSATTPITPCFSAPSGLVSWWPGEGNANDIWDGNNGTLENGATFAAGLVGLAFDFGAQGSYVSVPGASNLNLGTSDFTLESWINAETAQPFYPQIFSKRETAYDGFLFGLWSDGKLYVQIAGVNLATANSADLRDGNWHHVAAVRSAGQITYYVDGSQSGTVNSSASMNSSHALWIGDDEPNSPASHFNGRIDEPSIYNRTLSAAEIQSIYDAGSAGKCTSMHVASIDPFYQPTGNLYRVGTGVTINSPAPGTTISLDVTLPGGSIVSLRRTIDISGTVTVQTSSPTTGTYTFTVTNVSKAGWTYDPSKNVVTTTSELVPTEMHVASVNASYQPLGTEYQVSSAVTIHNQDEGPLSGTLVTVAVKMPDGSFISKQGTTDSSGMTTVSLLSSSTGTYVFKVVGVQKPPWNYDPSKNVQTSARITIP